MRNKLKDIGSENMDGNLDEYEMYEMKIAVMMRITTEKLSES